MRQPTGGVPGLRMEHPTSIPARQAKQQLCGRWRRGVSLRQALTAWLVFQIEVMVRRSQVRIGKIDDRLELLDGFLIAYLNLDRVIEIIRGEDEPKPLLMAAKIGPTPQKWRPHVLFRDEKGTYYYVDRGFKPGEEKRFDVVAVSGPGIIGTAQET